MPGVQIPLRPLEKEDNKMITRRTKEDIKNALIVIFLSLICIYFFISHFILKTKNSNQSINQKTLGLQTQLPKNLEEAVSRSLEGSNGTYSIVIKNLKNGQEFYLKDHQLFDAGSLYKLWVMAVSFDQIQKGELKIDEILSEDVSNLNDKFNISDDQAELTEGVVTLSVGDALKQMITISHNYAALLLTERIKLSSVNNFLEKNGFKESKVGTESESPTTTAADIALFFEKLYHGELADKDLTGQMLDLLKNQQLNDKLPKLLPQGILVAHKTGEIDYFSHDAGIVFSPKGDYIIVVLSKTDLPTAAEDRISKISKEVYDYFER